MDRKAVADIAAEAVEVLPAVCSAFWKGARPAVALYRLLVGCTRRCDGRRAARRAPLPRRLPPEPPPPPPAGCRSPCCLPCFPRARLSPLPPPEFDLEGLRSQLDEQGLAVATAQEASVRSRKALADRTKGEWGRGARNQGGAALNKRRCTVLAVRLGRAGRRRAAHRDPRVLLHAPPPALEHPQPGARRSAATLCPALAAAAEFRRGAEAEVARQVAPLLKSYQEEVDRLTSRWVLAAG